MSLKALSDYTFYSRYARYLPEKKRRETWKEAVGRVFDMHRVKYANQINENEELKLLIDEAEKMVMQKKVIGSQRALQFGGDATLKKNERIYNCSSGHIDRPRAFQEALFLLLCGVGVGFSTQYCHINKLPTVVKRTKGKKVYVIDDSIEGWANSVGVLMSSYFSKDQSFPEYFGYEIEFDFSQVRPKGALISWGGVAPGPDGLKSALDKIVKVIERRFSKLGKNKVSLPPIDCYDIIMHESDAVLSGGIRRSATINLFSPEDTEMANAKTGDWFLTNPQRGRSNNSALLIRNKTAKEEFKKLFESTKKFGEPGFVWAEHENITYNPCCEIGMWPIDYRENGKEVSGWQFCNLSEINGKKVVSAETFIECAKYAAIIGTLQAGYTDFEYLGKATENITRREALLGVSITGMMDNPDVIFNEENQRLAAKTTLDWNEKVAKMIGINPAARTTCVKPSGSASATLGSASGIHPHHSTKYLRRVQANKLEFPAQYFESVNPLAVEESVWSANKTDKVINFLCEVPPGAKLKNNISAVELLEHVKLTQNNWVEYGTRKEACVRDFVRHNVSNTITIRNEEWDDVEEYIYNNRDSFAGISLLSFSGDKDYDQAPFCAVYTPSELIKLYGDASVFASGLIVDCKHAFNTLWAGCDTLLGIGETLEVNRLREHIANCKEYGQNGFTIEVPSYPTSIKHIDQNSPDEELEMYIRQNTKNLEAKRDWIRRGQQFASRYFDDDIQKVTYCLKDVSNWKHWCDLKREYKEIDWSTVVEEDAHYIKVDEMAASACAGGKCEL
jgi:ribonucleoside-diphosphate reductase alpha chain